MPDLVYNLQNMVAGGETTTVGFEFYQGGLVNDQSNRTPVSVFTMITDTISRVTDQGTPFVLDTGALRLQLFAEGQRQGQRPGAQTETIVLEGAPSVLGGSPVGAPSPPPGPGGLPIPARPVIRAAGSVSAATPMWQDRIGHQWTLVNNVLTIH